MYHEAMAIRQPSIDVSKFPCSFASITNFMKLIPWTYSTVPTTISMLWYCYWATFRLALLWQIEPLFSPWSSHFFIFLFLSYSLIDHTLRTFSFYKFKLTFQTTLILFLHCACINNVTLDHWSFSIRNQIQQNLLEIFIFETYMILRAKWRPRWYDSWDVCLNFFNIKEVASLKVTVHNGSGNVEPRSSYVPQINAMASYKSLGVTICATQHDFHVCGQQSSQQNY